MSQPDPARTTFTPELATLDDSERVALCEVLDRVLNKGVVVAGELTISVAGVDLLYLGLQLALTSIETAREGLGKGWPASGLSVHIGKEKSSEPCWNNACRV